MNKVITIVIAAVIIIAIALIVTAKKPVTVGPSIDAPVTEPVVATEEPAKPVVEVKTELIVPTE